MQIAIYTTTMSVDLRDFSKSLYDLQIVYMMIKYIWMKKYKAETVLKVSGSNAKIVSVIGINRKEQKMNYKKIRKWILIGICILFLCLLLGIYIKNLIVYSGFMRSEEQKGWYIITSIHSTEQTDDYFLMGQRVLRQYSVSEQKIVNTYKIRDGEFLECYAADEDYVFLVREEPSEYNNYSGGEVWKIDRETGESELFLENSNIEIRWMELSDGYLLYGTLEPRQWENVYICPVDGNFETDSICLDEQIIEPTRLGWNFDETIYQGWRIIREGSDIHSIIEIESGEIIYSPTYQGDTILWTGEELIHFNEEFAYYNLNEKKGHSIECLDKWKYRHARIDGNQLMVENGKIIGLLVVSNKWMRTGWYYDLPQFDIKNDVLFEIDLETNTSKVIYSTKNYRTRIVGYKEGIVYLFKDGVIYSETIKGKDRKELLDLKEKGWDLYDLYAYPNSIYFDWHGNNLIIYNRKRTRIESVMVADDELQKNY